jgi:hypothetical protein
VIENIEMRIDSSIDEPVQVPVSSFTTAAAEHNNTVPVKEFFNMPYSAFVKHA